MPSVFTHDPDERLDYTFDWVDWLDSDEVISEAEVVADSVDIMLDAALVIEGRYVVVWAEGGVIGRMYKLTCHARTSVNREVEKSMVLVIRSK